MAEPAEDIVKLIATLDDGTNILEHADGRLERSRGKTDWARVAAITEEELEAAIANDPDWAEFENLDWSDAVLVIPPKKKAISIRLDEDVLDYFKRDGDGYQRRINAVLRSYMQQKNKPKKRA
ncbi:MAG: BrnA antitoxin family protein [Rhodopseudomonas sp.]|uniref:BrnA antitoxin family protein n=1 Tax=Rhodopseudomonas sp. TaxID=1078 RepID=UPI0017A21966|nr:BrnA antitoxin family protein [Rhodopseudomonas sp.]NVN84988.1 BrnA antitoxin family protein [Rhodopseudomonas sp.]